MDHKNDSSNRPNTSVKKRNIWRTLLVIFQISAILFFMGVFFAGGVAGGYVASLVKDDPVRSYNEINKELSSNNLTGFAYFRDKTLIGQLQTTEDRRLVTHKEVSPYFIDAVISTEDKEFYQHRGVVPTAIARAGIQQITGSTVQTGGSTLTQQLVKQTFLTRAQTMERKFREIFLAMRVERMFSKDQILDAYINKMYFGKSANGSNVYGIQAAAKGIFGVDAKDLNVPQSAYLAGMLQAPYNYIPFKAYQKNGLKAGLKRQKLVLSRMLENGKITNTQYDEALSYNIEGHLAQQQSIKAYENYPYLTMEIEKRAAEVLVNQDIEKNPDLKTKNFNQLVEERRMDIRQGGYHIYTTIDKKIYEKMREIASNANNFGPEKKPINGKKMPEQIGAALINNKTGAIISMIEGRGFNIEKMSHVTAPRQPGSTMKPIAVYAPAIERGIVSPGTTVVDEETEFPGYDKPPKNYGEKFRGPMTVRDALRSSTNIPALKVYFETGVPESLSYVKKMGVTSLDPVRDTGLATGLGGLTTGISVEELTNAYGTFANYGNFTDAYLIERIENSDHEEVYHHEVKPVRVFKPSTAWLVTDMLRDVIRAGTATKVRKYTSGRDVAGKTGTTNSNMDKWFVGYTPDVSLGVWIGYDKKYEVNESSFTRAQLLWGKIFTSAIKIDPSISPAGNQMAMPPGTSLRTVYNENLAKSTNPSSYSSYGTKDQRRSGSSTNNQADQTPLDSSNGSKKSDNGKNQNTDQQSGQQTDQSHNGQGKTPDQQPGRQTDTQSSPDHSAKPDQSSNPDHSTKSDNKQSGKQTDRHSKKKTDQTQQ
jgi:penicillin-binding protein